MHTPEQHSGPDKHATPPDLHEGPAGGLQTALFEVPGEQAVPTVTLKLGIGTVNGKVML